MGTKKLRLKTKSDYASVFNGLGAIINGAERPHVAEDDVSLSKLRVGLRIDLGKLGSMQIDLNRREFDRTANKMLGLAMRAVTS